MWFTTQPAIFLTYAVQTAVQLTEEAPQPLERGTALTVYSKLVHHE